LLSLCIKWTILLAAAANVSHEMSFIAKQVDEAIENSKNLTLHRDATTKLGRHFYGVHAIGLGSKLQELILILIHMKTVIEGVLRI
jgi:hypothetical protein